MDRVEVKQEFVEVLTGTNRIHTKTKNASGNQVIDLDSSDDDCSSSGDGIHNGKRSRGLSGGDEVYSHKRKKPTDGVVLPEGFLDPLPHKNTTLSPEGNNASRDRNSKQFWKAGDFEGRSGGNWDASSGGMDNLRVHPRFLHSNATSHKWVLGAFAELLDNAIDEVRGGATYVKIDMLTNKKDENRMLLIEDNGGGMDPEKMRQCMSLGYSLKSKVTDTIGQYGNGFKTSTMRLGADVIVFSRCAGKDGKRSTQSIGLLSYTFLRSTGKEDIVVPMLDYERGGRDWKKMSRVSASDWDRNVEAVIQWSPFSSEADLLRQFDHMKDQGTRIIIYNLWEDDQGQLELDFDTDEHDIQIRGVNRDEKNIEMAQQYPNSRHFLTYRHSLRSYASILYLRVPHCFRMVLRGKDVDHHNIVNDMMMTKEVTYRPQPGQDGIPKDLNMVATVTMGFVKDARSHIDIQGFNVYHKNRLIKPFWRLWNAAGSDGRGVIGVLEANFVEPAHDKQGFERTTVLSRLETRLLNMQKQYWSTYCHKIGYAPRRKQNLEEKDFADPSPDDTCDIPSEKKASASGRELRVRRPNKFLDIYEQPGRTRSIRRPTADFNGDRNVREKLPKVSGVGASSSDSSSQLSENIRNDDPQTTTPTRRSRKGKSTQETLLKDASTSVLAVDTRHHEAEQDCSPSGNAMQVVPYKFPGVGGNESIPSNNNSSLSIYQLMEENRELKERLNKREDDIFGNMLQELERERNRCKTLEVQIEEEKQKQEILTKEQESIISIFTEERQRRELEEEALRKKLQEAEVTTKNLLDKVKKLQSASREDENRGHKRGQ